MKLYLLGVMLLGSATVYQLNAAADQPSIVKRRGTCGAFCGTARLTGTISRGSISGVPFNEVQARISQASCCWVPPENIALIARRAVVIECAQEYESMMNCRERTNGITHAIDTSKPYYAYLVGPRNFVQPGFDAECKDPK